MKNNGKKFEEDIKRSFEKHNKYIYRLRDAGNLGNYTNTKQRFTINNIADMVTVHNNKMCFLELKTTTGKSLPFANIKKHQVTDTYEAVIKYPNDVEAFFLINFSEVENETYLVNCLDIYDFYFSKNEKNQENRKSFPISYIREHGIKVNHKKLKTRYIYDIKDMIDNIITIIK